MLDSEITKQQLHLHSQLLKNNLQTFSSSNNHHRKLRSIKCSLLHYIICRSFSSTPKWFNKKNIFATVKLVNLQTQEDHDDKIYIFGAPGGKFF